MYLYEAKKFNVKYITGIGAVTKPTDSYLLSIESEGIKLWRLLSPTVLIKWTDIQKISSETQNEASKSLSMGKAAVGLVLLGPLGALIGAGMGSKKPLFVSISYKDSYGEICECLVQTKQAHEIATKLNNERKEYYRKNNIPLTTETVSNLDQLEKLAELKDKGVISSDEFEAKKKQLLDL
ncbi:MAG: SHOCT domain-containing protein [Patescibacteria group bacterium]